jgi:hypothetical protein
VYDSLLFKERVSRIVGLNSGDNSSMRIVKWWLNKKIREKLFPADKSITLLTHHISREIQPEMYYYFELFIRLYLITQI